MSDLMDLNLKGIDTVSISENLNGMGIDTIKLVLDVDGADKLLSIKLSLGELGEKNVFAGIKSAYDPDQLIGKLVVMVFNLAPRKMKFGNSEGMILAASDADGGIFVVSPDQGAKPGQKIK